ncbi:MAG TPA: aminotransferase class I/II-fold pyridoxal phosphate-dependent enzyme, partial [Acidimicrobiales bacterium]|nr:aminotransferase class I/II-fold pyridoxal phosphate-dependent enzyme [Acidimicrobiales bacterium]
SASLNPVAPPVARVVGRHLDALDRYPDPSRATAALAEVLGVPAARVVLTNGGAEAIALVAAELGRGRVDDPDFSLYRRHLSEVVPDGPRIRSNPHNPTGALAGRGERAAVWDEAFYPLATGEWTRGDADHGAVVIGSLTKVFACPGLRAGFVVAPADDRSWAERVRGRQPQWSLNGLAAAAVPDLVGTADLRAWSLAIAGLRDQLVDLLRRNGFAPEPSDANYVLVPGAEGLRERLAARGVVVRDCSSFGLPGHVRVAVPSAGGLARLAGALAAGGADGRRGLGQEAGS